MANSEAPWIVETAEEKEVYYHERKAIGVAEDFQLKGKDVCVYHKGEVKHKFHGYTQYSLGLNYDRFSV